MLKLDAIEISDRIRTYRTRPVGRVLPRSQTGYLQKRVGIDVWEATAQGVNLKKQITQPSQVVNKELKAIKKANTQNSSNLEGESKYINANKKLKATSRPTANVKKDDKLQVIDFAESANQWKLNKRANKGLSISSFKVVNIKNYALYGMAVVVFLIGIVAALRSLMVDQQISQTVSAQSVSNEPEETKPSDDDLRSYNVAPDMPRIISIPKLNVQARVRQTVVKSDGSLDAPKNIHDAGWYSQSAKPGSQGGASLFDGHVSGPTQKGVFYKLETLKAGDIIIIERGDGSKVEYSVVKSEVVKATDTNMSKMMLPITAGKHGLNLITCTGKFDSKTKTYEDRALVYAEFAKIY